MCYQYDVLATYDDHNCTIYSHHDEAQKSHKR